MKYGFVKTAAVSPKIRVADTEYNAQETIRLMREAWEKGARIIVFPELSITGYTCSDLFRQEILLEGAKKALQEIVAASKGMDGLFFAGLPLEINGKLYNVAAAYSDGHLLGLVPKAYIPNYSEFYESRYFAPAPEGFGWVSGFWSQGRDVPFGKNVLFTHGELPELSVGCEICEDLWAPRQPSQDLALAGATIIVNLSASPAVIGKGTYRRDLVASQSARLMCGYLYACACCQESTQDLVYAGHNLIAENGIILAESATMDPDFLVSEIDVRHLITERTRQSTYCASRPERLLELPLDFPLEPTLLTRTIDPHPFVPADSIGRQSRCEEILSIQAAGLAKRLDHTQARTAVVGLSGGLDSTLALLVMARAADRLEWDRKRLIAVTMPCYGTTSRTRSNAENMALALGVTFREIPIGQSVAQHFSDIGLPPDDRSVTYENGQARERTQVLMDLANRLGGLVIGTGDLSELALGWATYNGDHMSMYAVNAGVPKTLVRHIVDYVAAQSDTALSNVLRDILATPVSPELLPPTDGEISQKTEDLVGPYELHDFFLYQVVRCGYAPGKVYRLARLAFRGRYPNEEILRWLQSFYRRFFQQQFKRSCLPDGPKVGSVTLSPRGDWRMPSDAAAGLWLKELENLEPSNC